MTLLVILWVAVGLALLVWAGVTLVAAVTRRLPGLDESETASRTCVQVGAGPSLGLAVQETRHGLLTLWWPREQESGGLARDAGFPLHVAGQSQASTGWAADSTSRWDGWPTTSPEVCAQGSGNREQRSRTLLHGPWLASSWQSC